MFTTGWGIVHNGKVEPIEDLALAEGSKVLITVLPPEDEKQFWLQASQSALASVWENSQDDVYAQLLEK